MEDFVIAGSIGAEVDWAKTIPQPYILKIKDPYLVGEDCALTEYECQRIFPQLWYNIDDKLALAKDLIETARQSGRDPSIIDVMELEYSNAENAQKKCDLDSAKRHLNWIIQAAPEPGFQAIILLIPIVSWWIYKTVN
jgi:hypothetical protein